MSISKNLKSIKLNIPPNVCLVAVSKTKSESDILEAYNYGQRVFGENKVQEMALKYKSLPKDIKWHMIGNLQRNKVKYIAPFVDLIHGVDSVKLLKEINKQGIKNNRVIKCLIQIKISNEESKSGIKSNNALELLNSGILNEFENVKITGLMGMGSFTKNEEILDKEFKLIKDLFHQVKNKKNSFSIISMGMSNDYTLAIKNGSNMIRVGSSIFGNRY